MSLTEQTASPRRSVPDSQKGLRGARQEKWLQDVRRESALGGILWHPHKTLMHVHKYSSPSHPNPPIHRPTRHMSLAGGIHLPLRPMYNNSNGHEIVMTGASPRDAMEQGQPRHRSRTHHQESDRTAHQNSGFIAGQQQGNASMGFIQGMAVQAHVPAHSLPTELPAIKRGKRRGVPPTQQGANKGQHKSPPRSPRHSPAPTADGKRLSDAGMTSPSALHVRFPSPRHQAPQITTAAKDVMEVEGTAAVPGSPQRRFTDVARRFSVIHMLRRNSSKDTEDVPHSQRLSLAGSDWLNRAMYGKPTAEREDKPAADKEKPVDDPMFPRQEQEHLLACIAAAESSKDIPAVLSALTEALDRGAATVAEVSRESLLLRRAMWYARIGLRKEVSISGSLTLNIQAEADCTLVITTCSNHDVHALALTCRASLYASTRCLDKALHDLTAAVSQSRVCKHCIEYWFVMLQTDATLLHRARLYKQMGQMDKAMQDCEDSLRVCSLVLLEILNLTREAQSK